jgi:hypothetical protein
MEKNSERSAKMFNDKLVFGDGPVYLTTHLIVTSLERQLRPPHPAIPLAWKRKSSGLHIIRVFFWDKSWQRGKEKTEGPEGTKGFLYGKNGLKLSHYKENKI